MHGLDLRQPSPGGLLGRELAAKLHNMAASNETEDVTAVIEPCSFRDNEICFRLRGPTGPGDALVTIADCALFDSQIGARMENGLRDLRIHNLAFGSGVERKHQMIGGTFPGYENQGETVAESFELLMQNGWR